MNWGTTGDGYSRPRTLLLMRYLMTNPNPASFPHAVQDVTVPGTEQQVMGSYLPTVTYTDRAHHRHAKAPPDRRPRRHARA
jgi:hypothetical protein